MSKKTTAYARKRRALGLSAQPDPSIIALPVNIRFASSHEIDLQLNPHTTLDKFQEGVADESDWHLLALRVNWGKVLSEQHWPQAVGEMIAAQESLLAVRARNEDSGTWDISALEYVAIGAALNMADTLQLHCTRRQLSDALQAVYRADDVVAHRRSWRALEATA